MARARSGNAGKRGDPGKPSVKKELTRVRILSAARRVFARHPYHSASMRMIGAEGRFDHALIRYHFRTKAILFEALLGDICEELRGVNASCLERAAGLTLDLALGAYLDGFLDYHFADPSAFRIIILNLALSERPETIPGYRHIPEMLSKTGADFMRAAQVAEGSGGAERYFYSFNNLLINFLGAGACQRMLIGMKRNDPRYRQWVRDTMTYLFLPPLRELLGRE